MGESKNNGGSKTKGVKKGSKTKGRRQWCVKDGCVKQKG